MLKTKKLAPLLFLLLVSQTTVAQSGFSNEIGIIIGPTAFKSDYGERSDFNTNAGNNGFGIGLVHYMNFSYSADYNIYTRDNYFNDHFKLRTEISWNRAKLEHIGKYVEPSKIGDFADKLRAHTGVANNLDIGIELEYFPLSIRSFQAYGHTFAPFISLGVHYVFYNPKVSTTYGDGDTTNLNNFYDPWSAGNLPDPIDINSGSTWSFVSSIGVRYKIARFTDLMLDLRGQYYLSDWVDGLNHKLDSNKYNDWLVWLNLGYIYYLD